MEENRIYYVGIDHGNHLMKTSNHNLRDQISYMCDEKAKPMDFGLRVATHPELKISSPRKVKSGTMQKLDFSNTLTVTRDIDVDCEESTSDDD